jgi:peptidoglycan/xylan/chitin deacetylase (PgdA/CDA1 family)
MLKRIKTRVLEVALRLGVSRILLESRWRQERLLILCYHGIAMEDEHLWRPPLYMPSEVFARRLELLQKSRCVVLPLAQALTRLYAGNLPPRSVVITVDDGGYDFYRIGFPMFQKFGYPVTVYLTTYYSDFNRPVFDPALAYLLWKASGRLLDWPRLFSAPVRLGAGGLAEVTQRVQEYCRLEGLSGCQKDGLLAELASHTGVDYAALCSRRLFTLMTAEEVREVAAAGVDIQLHTHRHRVYRQKDAFLREIDENQARIYAMTGSHARHFCYPGGGYLPEFVPWLREWGVESATTCVSGLASRASNQMLLPRLVDVPAISEIGFQCWLSGLAAFLPRRPHRPDYWSLKTQP